MNDFPITVIISTYNRPDALDLVLRGCLAQTDRNFDIIVADDGSTDATRALVTRHAGQDAVPVQHVWHPDNGFRVAEIRNKGIARARGDYLIFLDGDCVPQHDFVARHRRLARPGATVTGSRILLDETLTRQAIASPALLADHGPGFWLKQRLAGRVNKIAPLFFKLPDQGWRNVEGFRWKGIKGCNMAAWKSDLERINGFDSSFVGWGHEDADLVVRLFNAGVKRKLGAYATEIWHLWHKEQPRSQENSNYQVVKARIADGALRAARGLAEI